MMNLVVCEFPSLYPMTSTGYRKHIASSNNHFEYANTLRKICQSVYYVVDDVFFEWCGKVSCSSLYLLHQNLEV